MMNYDGNAGRNRDQVDIQRTSHVTPYHYSAMDREQITVEATRPQTSAHPQSGALGACDLKYKGSAHPGLTALCNIPYAYFV